MDTVYSAVYGYGNRKRLLCSVFAEDETEAKEKLETVLVERPDHYKIWEKWQKPITINFKDVRFKK